MADINRNEEKVPAPEEIHGLAAALDQFGADFDPYEYMDTVEDKEQNIRDTEAMLLAGKTDGLKNYLMGFIDDSRDPQAVQAAQELMKRLEEIAPQNALRTAEMSMEQNCNMIDGIPNNTPLLPSPPEPDKKPLDKVKEPPCLLYTSPSPRDLSTSRMPSSA